MAKQKGISKEDAQRFIANREQEYCLGPKANTLSEYTGRAGATEGVKRIRLAAASGAYLLGGKLVNKWYSLDGHFDKDGNVILENRRALTAQLELARRNAREAAARAKAVGGFVPTAARLSCDQSKRVWTRPTILRRVRERPLRAARCPPDRVALCCDAARDRPRLAASWRSDPRW